MCDTTNDTPITLTRSDWHDVADAFDQLPDRHDTPGVDALYRALSACGLLRPGTADTR